MTAATDAVLREEWTGTITRNGHIATIRNERRELVADVYGETPEQVHANVRYVGNALRMVRLLQEWVQAEAQGPDAGPCRLCRGEEHTDSCPVSKAIGLLLDLSLQPEPAEATA